MMLLAIIIALFAGGAKGCSESELWLQCANCDPTCNNPSPDCADAECKPGCACRPGRVRQSLEDGYKCIPVKNCQEQNIAIDYTSVCGPNQEFATCMGCIRTCMNRNGSLNCPLECTPGCECKTDYLRDIHGRCIEDTKCKRDESSFLKFRRVTSAAVMLGTTAGPSEVKESKSTVPLAKASKLRRKQVSTAARSNQDKFGSRPYSKVYNKDNNDIPTEAPTATPIANILSINGRTKETYDNLYYSILKTTETSRSQTSSHSSMVTSTAQPILKIPVSNPNAISPQQAQPSVQQYNITIVRKESFSTIENSSFDVATDNVTIHDEMLDIHNTSRNILVAPSVNDTSVENINISFLELPKTDSGNLTNNNLRYRPYSLVRAIKLPAAPSRNKNLAHIDNVQVGSEVVVLNCPEYDAFPLFCMQISRTYSPVSFCTWLGYTEACLKTCCVALEKAQNQINSRSIER